MKIMKKIDRHCEIIIGWSTVFCKIQGFICTSLRPAENHTGRAKMKMCCHAGMVYSPAIDGL